MIHYKYDRLEKRDSIGFHSEFLINPGYYAITNNPYNVDSLDYINDNSNVMGAIWGRFIGPDSTNKTILNYNINQLVPNSPIKLILKYRSVLDPKSDMAKKCDSIGNKTISFKVDINPYSSNSSLDIDVPEIKTGEGGLFVYDKAYVDSIGAFSFNVNVPGQQDWSSFEITSIEVYNAFTPVVISSEESFTCDGDSVIVKLNQKCSRNVACQWYNDTIAISGATGRSYTFEALMSQSYNLNLELICDSDIINTKCDYSKPYSLWRL